MLQRFASTVCVEMAVLGASGLTFCRFVRDEVCMNKHPITKPPIKVNTLYWVRLVVGFSSGMLARLAFQPCWWGVLTKRKKEGKKEEREKKKEEREGREGEGISFPHP